MDNATMQRMRQHITENEKEIPAPYKDNKGLLTVGAGFKVDDVKSFVAIPFEITDLNTGELRPATEAKKIGENVDFYSGDARNWGGGVSVPAPSYRSK